MILVNQFPADKSSLAEKQAEPSKVNVYAEVNHKIWFLRSWFVFPRSVDTTGSVESISTRAL